ncbi:MAG: DUF58 domain-containing protein [Planctomycetota bacterium]
MRTGATRSLPCPGVRFEEGFARRLEAFGTRLAAARERRESGGMARATGGGAEFVGYRPYAPGDDPRTIDWNLMARSQRAWVKVSRREAGERWFVALDTTASMGVGPPGKMQRAAEVAAALASLAVAAGAQARIVAASRAFEVRRRPDLVGLLAFLETLRAEGPRLERPLPRVSPETSRVFLVGDLRDTTPEEVLGLRQPGRELALVQLLAPIEIVPPLEGAVQWWDPEANAVLALEIDGATRRAYETELERELEVWRAACARRGVPYSCSSSASTFEEILRGSAVA